MANRPSISVVIPTYHALRFLPACLTAIRSQLAAHDEIVLVDNHSRDRAAAWVRAFMPMVHVIELSRNTGFAGGVNAGIAAARGDLIMLINDDALAEPGCVDALWQALRARPTAGWAAGVLTFSRRPELVASAGIRFLANGIATDRAIGLPVVALPSQPLPVFGASGGLTLMRREMLADIGDFADFFSYLEDADLAWRAQLRGWDCVLAPQARARHVYSATAGMFSPLKQRLLGRNRIRMLIRCVPTPLLTSCLPLILAYDGMALAYAVLHRQPAMIAGRCMALAEWPALLAQRRQIQARRTASLAALARWIELPDGPLAVLRRQQQLAAMVG
ncbi:glycosyltransferase family 2 protein [Chloroflexus sp.]|uniref:glycosyltransferase family 2 protein n=1 Tax=Chloroflexus sp. TaxID=1904827 RepID=UPI00260340DF|nr:glycosyltransferase family 2 protein [uncultured Chloroflexus sp.]